MSVNIHPSAIVSKQSKLGIDVKIGPFAVISDNVEIGDRTEIYSHAVIDEGTTIGNDCKIYSGAVIGTEPQDLKYADEPTQVFLGDSTVVREYATINRGTMETGKTVVGRNCMIMAYCHVAHDCILGDHIIMSNATQLGGHVVAEDWVIFGGVTKVHQFCHIGRHSMIGADVKVVKDVAPYVLIGKNPAQVEGINKVGLRRRGFSNELIREIEDFYDTLIFSGLNTSDGIREFSKREKISDEVRYCIEYIQLSKRGIHR